MGSRLFSRFKFLQLQSCEHHECSFSKCSHTVRNLQAKENRATSKDVAWTRSAARGPIHWSLLLFSFHESHKSNSFPGSHRVCHPAARLTRHTHGTVKQQIHTSLCGTCTAQVRIPCVFYFRKREMRQVSRRNRQQLPQPILTALSQRCRLGPKMALCQS